MIALGLVGCRVRGVAHAEELLLDPSIQMRARWARLRLRRTDQCGDSGSRMGAARLSQTFSDAVIVSVRRSLTCADALNRPVWLMAHSVRDEEAASSSRPPRRGGQPSSMAHGHVWPRPAGSGCQGA